MGAGAGVGAGEAIVDTNKSSSSNRRRKGKRGSLKECNIGRDKVTLKSGTITHIPVLNTRISHKDTLEGLWIKFRDLRTNILNKACLSKYLGSNREQRIIWKQLVVRSSSIKNR